MGNYADDTGVSSGDLVFSASQPMRRRERHEALQPPPANRLQSIREMLHPQEEGSESTDGRQKHNRYFFHDDTYYGLPMLGFG